MNIENKAPDAIYLYSEIPTLPLPSKGCAGAFLLGGDIVDKQKILDLEKREEGK